VRSIGNGQWKTCLISIHFDTNFACGFQVDGDSRQDVLENRVDGSVAPREEVNPVECRLNVRVPVDEPQTLLQAPQAAPTAASKKLDELQYERAR
jgi:hypothetical protein